MGGKLDIRTSSEEDTIRLGVTLGELLKPGDVVLLIGDLGSGKTRLAKGLVSGATGVHPDEVVSPTFTLVHCFEGEFPVYHADLYRLEGPRVDEIGLDDTVASGGALVVEWAEKILGFDPDPLTISIHYGEEDSCRICVLEWHEDGSWNERLRGLVREAGQRRARQESGPPAPQLGGNVNQEENGI